MSSGLNRDRLRIDAMNHGPRVVLVLLDGLEAAERELDRTLGPIWDVAQRYLPAAIGYNTLPEIMEGIARQRDHQHELKDHLAETAHKLTNERDELRARLAAAEARIKDYSAVIRKLSHPPVPPPDPMMAAYADDDYVPPLAPVEQPGT